MICSSLFWFSCILIKQKFLPWLFNHVFCKFKFPSTVHIIFLCCNLKTSSWESQPLQNCYKLTLGDRHTQHIAVIFKPFGAIVTDAQSKPRLYYSYFSLVCRAVTWVWGSLIIYHSTNAWGYKKFFFLGGGLCPW